MQRRRFSMYLVVVSFLMILSGCLGNNPMLMEEPPPIDPAVEAALAELRAVRDIADSLLASDVVFAPPGEDRTIRLRGHTSCGRTQCLSNVLGEPFLRIILRASDAESSRLSYGDEVTGGDFESYRGISLGGFRRQLQQRSERVEIDTDILSYEGWLQYSAFSISLNAITHGIIRGRTQDYDLTGEQYGFARSVGQATDTNPIDGEAVWRGVMAGGEVRFAEEIGVRVEGDATLTYDFLTQDIDVAFTNIRQALDPTAPAYAPMTWENLPVTEGRFGAGFDAPSIEGRFYGPNHEEVGGIFERNQIIGAFGAQREPPMGAPSMGEGM